MTGSDYLTRLIAKIRTIDPKVALEAERTLLKEEISTIEGKRDAAIAEVWDCYEPQLIERRKQLQELEGRISGEQTSLFGASLRRGMEEGHELVRVAPVVSAFSMKCGPSLDATNGPTKDSPFNAAKYPASQEPIGPVIPCYSPDPAAPVKLTVHKARKQEDGTASPEILFEWPELTISSEAIEGEKARLEAKLQEPVESLEVLTACRAPRIAMTIQRNGKTYYRFKSAGYKAIAQRLGIVPYVECEGDKAFYLTANEYARVFTEHKKMESQREHS